MPVDFHFLNPSAAWLFSFLPIYFWMWITQKERKKKQLRSFLHQKSRSRMVRRPKEKQEIARFIFFIFGVSLLIVAMMRPVGNPRYIGIDQKGEEQVFQEWVLLIDHSSSMAVQDGGGGKSRLEMAREVANALLQKLPSGPVSLYSFTEGIEEWVPSTWDRLFVRMMLDSIPQQIGEKGGTDYLQAIQAIMRRVSQESNELQKIVILLSDGGDTQFEVSKGEQRGERKKAILSPLQERKKWNLHFVTLGIGSEVGGEVPEVIYQGSSVRSRLQTELLQPIADQGGGELFLLKDQPPLVAVEHVVKWLSKMEQRVASREMDQSTRLMYTHLFQYPLFFSIVFFLLSFSLRFYFPFFVLLIFTGSLQGDELEMQKANFWVSLGEFNRAKAIYSQLQDELEKPWQQALLKFNRATLSLKEREFEAASEGFKELLVQDNLSPILLPKIHHHFALSQLGQEKMNIKQYLTAREHLSLEKKKWCDLQKFLGKSECEAPLKYKRARQALLDQKGVFRLRRKNALLTTLHQESISQRMQYITEEVPEGIPGFSDWVENMIKQKSLSKKDSKVSLDQTLCDQVKLELWGYEMGRSIPEHLTPLLQRLEMLDELGFWKKWVQYNLGYLKKSKKEQVRVYLKAIFLALAQIASEQDVSSSPPKATLTKGIKTQDMLWELSQFSNAQGIKMPSSYFKGGEGWVLQTVLPFVEEVIELQKKRLMESSSCDPLYWEEVLLFFEEGKERATLALQNFEKESFDQAVDEQEETLFFWEKALEMLDELAPMEEDRRKMEELELIQQLFELDKRDRPEQKVPTGSKGESLW